MTLKKITDLILKAQQQQLELHSGAKRPTLTELEFDFVEELKRDFDKYWETEGQERNIESDGFHPSHLGLACGKCARRAYYLLNGESKQQDFSARTKRIFANGTAVHIRTQETLSKLDAYSFEAEVPVRLSDPPVVGHADGVLTNIAKQFCVLLEIKSINKNGFELRVKWKKPLDKHFDQANMYSYLLDLEYILFIYENKDTQELLYFLVKADHEAAYKQIKKWSKIYAAWKRQELPTRPYKETSDSCQYCFASETKILTQEGTKEIGSLVGQTVSVMTERGRWIDAPIKSFGEQQLFKLTISRARVEKNIFVTGNHLWYVKKKQETGGWNIKKTIDLSEGQYLRSSFQQGINNRLTSVRPSTFGIAHGLVFGDGHRFRKGSAINLYGEKNLNLLRWFNNSNTNGFPSGTYGEAITVVDLPGYFKDRPSLSESKSYLYGWLAGYFGADGCVTKNGETSISSSNFENLQLVKDICYIIGVRTFGIREELRTGLGQTEPSSLFRLTFMRQSLTEEFFIIDYHKERFLKTKNNSREYRWKIVNVESTDRVEEVYCAIVPETHTFTLDDNILTHNCDCKEICWIRDIDLEGTKI